MVWRSAELCVNQPGITRRAARPPFECDRRDEAGETAKVNGDRWARRWLPVSGAAIGAALIAIPLLAMAIRAVLTWSSDGWPYLSIGNFIALLGDNRFGDALANTAIASLFT